MTDVFSILSVRLPSAPSFPSTAIHEIRIRRNAPKIPTENDSRSLFLKNVPVDSTESHFRALFADLVGAGRFESITFDDESPEILAVDPDRALKVNAFARKRKRGDMEEEERRREEMAAAARLQETWTRPLHTSSGAAVVLLADEKSVQLVLKAIAKLHKTKKYPVWGNNVADNVPSLGSAWIAAHLQLSRADKMQTKRAVHAFFDDFNAKEKEAAELAKRLRNEPDDDGFVTVTRGGRVAPASRNEAEEAKTRMLDRESKKKDEMKDFYRFQLRERRKKEQAALLRRFDEDRRKVNSMREKRGKFRPET